MRARETAATAWKWAKIVAGSIMVGVVMGAVLVMMCAVVFLLAQPSPGDFAKECRAQGGLLTETESKVTCTIRQGGE